MQLMDIINFQKVNSRIATSGQPSPTQFEHIAQSGYGLVINLAMPDSDNALPDEGALVSSLGLKYIHIPVKWDSPQVSDLEYFCKIMNASTEQKTWVHCALNMRASCFVFLYQTLELGIESKHAKAPLETIWHPQNDKVWGSFISAATLSKLSSSSANLSPVT